MDYLNTTLVLLEQENKQLRDKLKRMTELNQLVNLQREDQEKNYLASLHQQEINVIREMSASNQQKLRGQIKKQNQEINEINCQLEQEIDRVSQLKKIIQKNKQEHQIMKGQNESLKVSLKTKQQQIQSMQNDFEARYQYIEQQFMQRQQQIMNKYMEKLQQVGERHDEQVKKHQKRYIFLESKLNRAEEEKEMLEQQLSKMICTFKGEQTKIYNKNKNSHQEVIQLRSQNSQLHLDIKNMEMDIYQLEAKLKEEQKNKNKLETEAKELSKKIKDLQCCKNKQILRQKNRNRSICNDLTAHQKYIKSQSEREKVKQKQFSYQKKMLINKIKQVKNQLSQNQNSSCLFNNTTLKQTNKSIDTFQSISLDNSFTKQRDSPFVSCFIKEDSHNKSPLQSKKNLKIDPKICSKDFLKLNDLQTPSFQDSKDKIIKRTIKIRK